MAATITINTNVEEVPAFQDLETGVDFEITTDPMSADLLNIHRDNMINHKRPKYWELTWVTDDPTVDNFVFSTTSSAFVPLPEILLPIEATGGRNLFIQFNGIAQAPTGVAIYLRVTMDGFPIDTVATLGDAFLQATGTNSRNLQPFSISHVLTGVAAGPHVLGIDYRTDGASGLYHRLDLKAWEIT